MLYSLVLLFLVINTFSSDVGIPNVVQGAPQKSTKPPLTTLSAKITAKGAAQKTTKPSLTPWPSPAKLTAKGAATTKKSVTTLPANTANKTATKPPEKEWHATDIKLIQAEVTKILYITKSTTPTPQATTEITTEAPTTTIPPATTEITTEALTTTIPPATTEITTEAPTTTIPPATTEITTEVHRTGKRTPTKHPDVEVVIEIVQGEMTERLHYSSTEIPVIDCCGYMDTGAQCPPNYDMIHGHCYHFSEKRVQWNVALEECELLGGRLAVLENPLSFKQSFGQKDENGTIFWIGGNHYNGTWGWIDGQPLGAEFPWGLQKPLNSSLEQSCLMLNQEMGVYVVYHKGSEDNGTVNPEEEHTTMIAGGGFTNDRCNKMWRFICDTSPIGSLCPTKYEKNPEMGGLSSIESLTISNTRRAPKYPAKCPKNFQNVSGMCVYFSEVKKCWEDAAVFCKNLRIGTARQVTLAVLTEDVAQNHHLLDEIAKRGKSVWLGGFNDQLSMNHMWVDGRLVNLAECHWNETEPDHSGNCISAEVKMMLETRRSYLYDEDCSSPKYFACTATCPKGFEEHGDSCYRFITEPTTWKTAEKRCQDLGIGLDQNVHLATFGTDTEDDMNLLAEIAYQEKDLYHCFRGEMIGHQCMHIQSEKMDFESARITCEQSGMILAEPRDPHALATFMQKKSKTGQYYLGGHYMDGNMAWIYRDGFVFSNDLSVWVKGFPGRNLSVDSALSMTLEIDGPLFVQDKSNHAKFICEEKLSYWVGGSRTYFKDWIWTNGKQVDLNSPYFAKKEPRLENDLNCLLAEQSESAPNKAFLKSDCCECLNRYICQVSDINPFGKEFVHIGDGYYYISTMNNHSVTTWQEARNICQGLEVPEMYTVDLAVLNRQDQRDSVFEIDFLSMNKGFSLWIGAYGVTTNNITNWVWVNTQQQHQEILQPESIYWSLDLDTTPIAGANVYLTWDKWETSFNDVKQAIATHKESVIARTCQGGFRKPVLYWDSSDSTNLRAFVCQVFDKI